MSGTWQTTHLLVLATLSFKSSVFSGYFDCLKWRLEAAQHEDKQSIGAYNFNSFLSRILFRIFVSNIILGVVHV